MKVLGLHLGLLALLAVLGMVLPAYHQGNLSRIMVLATYAVGYNVMFGYTGLLSLGHAMFFGTTRARSLSQTALTTSVRCCWQRRAPRQPRGMSRRSSQAMASLSVSIGRALGADSPSPAAGSSRPPSMWAL